MLSTDIALARVSNAGAVTRLSKLASSPESEYLPALAVGGGNLLAVWTSEESSRDPITGRIKRDTDVLMSVTPVTSLR